jgi:ABC-2 type transport system ATP-binding protein
MILSFENVSKSYGNVCALDGISFTIARGEIVALLGPNGAGKTTALEIATGLRHADAGVVRLFGGSPNEASTRRRLGVTPQESGFPDNLRVEEIVAFAAAHYDCARIPADVLREFGLDTLRLRRAATLSGGESRRLAVALAFCGDPELAVFDEPTTGLDVESRRRLWEAVRASAQRRSVLFTTHYLEEAEANASRIIVVDRGRVLFDGEARNLRTRFGMRRLSYVGNPIESSDRGFRASVVHENGRVVVATNDSDAYVRALVSDGTPFAELEIAPASLEEAFLTLTEISK